MGDKFLILALQAARNWQKVWENDLADIEAEIANTKALSEELLVKQTEAHEHASYWKAEADQVEKVLREKGYQFETRQERA